MINANRRWVRVGHGAGASVRAAAVEATEAALDGPDPRLLVVFGPGGYSPEEIGEAVGETAGGVPFIGSSTSGHIGSGGTPDEGVLVVGIGGDVEVEASCATGLDQRPRDAGNEVGQALRHPSGSAQQLVLMFADNMTTDQQELVRGAYSAFGASVPVIGAVSGYGVANRYPAWQLYNGKVMEDAVVAASLFGDLPIGVSVRHGWRPAGDTMVTTGSAGNHVYTLDDQPALDVYLDRHHAPEGIEEDQLAFREFALTRPLAISRRGEVAVRHVVRAIPADGTLVCAAAIPRGAGVWLGTTDVEATLGATAQAMDEALADLGGAQAQGMLVFDCAGRRGVLDQAVLEEWELMRAGAGDVPVAGFYGNGEIARVRGANGYFNHTIVACALG
jgi:hypothetical protein